MDVFRNSRLFRVPLFDMSIGQNQLYQHEKSDLYPFSKYRDIAAVRNLISCTWDGSYLNRSLFQNSSLPMFI